MPSLLIVDDDSVIRGMFARALQQLGDIDQAQSGAEALRSLGSKRFDVVLLDLHMPMVDGFVVLQMLATKPGPNQNTPVFVITADTSERARIEALRRKAVFFLTKPVHLATLQSLIEGALRKGSTKSPRAGSIPDIEPPKSPALSNLRATGSTARPTETKGAPAGAQTPSKKLP